MAFPLNLVRWYIRRYLTRVERVRREPHLAQRETLEYLVRRLARTYYGRALGVQPNDPYQAFVQKVPLVEYECIAPLIARAQRGERDILWPGRTKWYAQSSGTSGSKSKFIPVTRENLLACHYRGGYDVLAVYFDRYPKSGLFAGRGLTMGGSHRLLEENSDTRVGDLSAILLQNTPRWVDFARSPSRPVALEANWQRKLEGIAKEAIKQNITSITGVPSWNLLMLEHILKETKRDNLLEVWPNLELFIHGGVNFTPYREQYRRLIPSEGMHYLETYNASEGFFALQDLAETSDMLLMLDYGVFFEFIDMEDFRGTESSTVPLEGVEAGRNYALVISSTNGLWRYIIGDTIQFNAVAPYRLAITGRTTHFINAFGEEVIIQNVEQGLGAACRACGAEVAEYTVAPLFMTLHERGAHEYYIEFRQPPKDMDLFIDILDRTVASVNSDYEAKRQKTRTLAPPRIHSLPKGTFFRWMLSRGKVGGQNKVPRLANHREYVDALARFSQQAG